MTNGRIRIQRERSVTDIGLRILDAVCILLGFHVAAQYPGAGFLDDSLSVVATAILACWLCGEFTGLYRCWRTVSLYREISTATFTWSYAVGGLLTVGFLTRFTDQVPRPSMVLVATTTAVLFAAVRVILRSCQRWLHCQGYGRCRFAVVGLTQLGVRLAEDLSRSRELGLELLGFYDDRCKKRTVDLPEHVGELKGSITQLVALARAGEVDRIYITLPMRAEGRTRQLLQQLADTTASVYIVPDFFVFELLHSRWTDINGLPAVSVFENPFYGVDGLLKRLVDVVLAGLSLLAAALPMLMIGLLVKLTSPGPMFFRQKRYGLDGREILVWKFRSMTVSENGQDVQQATQGDSRVTNVGAVLRRTSLDELPQLFNVIEGTMSLVGPRPHASAHNEHYRRLIPGYMLRHKVKPGITGLAQVLGWRGETDTLDKMANRVQCDLQYIREWSLWLDLKILLKTILVVVSGKNAY